MASKEVLNFNFLPRKNDLIHYSSYIFKINKVEKIIIELNNSQVVVYAEALWIEGGSSKNPPPEGSSAGKFILNREENIHTDINCHVLYHVSNLGIVMIFSMHDLINKTKEVDPFINQKIEYEDKDKDNNTLFTNDKSYIFLDLD